MEHLSFHDTHVLYGSELEQALSGRPSPFAKQEVRRSSTDGRTPNSAGPATKTVIQGAAPGKISMTNVRKAEQLFMFGALELFGVEPNAIAREAVSAGSFSKPRCT